VPRRKYLDWALAGFFLICIALPGPVRLLGLEQSTLSENRELARAPDWPKSLAELWNLPSEFHAFWQDQFGLRQLLIRAHVRMKLALGLSPSDLVLLGKSNWFFYARNGSIDYFRHAEPFDERGLAAWRQSLEARRDWLAQRGIHYLVVFVPMKETIYPEFYPERYQRIRSESRLDQLMEELRTHSTLEVLDLRPRLLKDRSRSDVYDHTDTHWNGRGGYAGYDELMRRLSKWFPVFAQRKTRWNMIRWRPNFSGDLIWLLGAEKDIQETSYQFWPDSPWWSAVDIDFGLERPPGTQQLRARRGADPTRPRVLFFHDSFFDRILEALSEDFSSSYFAWQWTFTRAFVEHTHPDVVVQEMAETALVKDAPQEDLSDAVH
jgi:hypothetical protein